MELQRRYEEITREGLGLVAISYDAPATLKAFATSRGITFPMLSDPGSAIIRRYGLLNEQQTPGTRFYGIPHPGTFIVDPKGVVTARYFEQAYQERFTAATILASQGGGASGVSVAAETRHLTLRVTAAETSVAPGERIAIVAEVTPRRSMHVYAPGKHDYRVVELQLDPQPWLRVHATTYPPAEIYHFKPLDERVEVYRGPFRLTRDATILATPEAQKLLASAPTVTITGTLEYQACDDSVCYTPVRVPISLPLTVTALDRRPPDE